MCFKCYKKKREIVRLEVWWTHHSEHPVQDEVDADVGAGGHVHDGTYGAQVKDGGQRLQELGLAGPRTVQMRGTAQL